MSQGARRADVQNVRWPVTEQYRLSSFWSFDRKGVYLHQEFAKYMQTEQINQSLITRCH